MEYSFTDGEINIKGNVRKRKERKKADYLLSLNEGNPIAVVEAKKYGLPDSLGLQQAKEYAQILDLKFAYSSSGQSFEEYDFLTGSQRTLKMEDFPTPKELEERYKKEINDGSGLTSEEEKMIDQPFYTNVDIFPPRYYQRIAVNRTLDAIAKGQKRILLVLATGTGKTYTAFQIVWRLLQIGPKMKILYLSDRNNLIDQTIKGDFLPLKKASHKVNFAKDSKVGISAYQVFFALYQQLAGNENGDEDEENGEEPEEILAHYKELFSPDFFDLVIVDECHRGSVKQQSRWRKILEYFTSAIQIGMTATPKETNKDSNIDYFKEPIYKYSLKEGIDDGFLAPYKVIRVFTNIDDGWRPQKGQLDISGNEIPDRIYDNKDYDYNICLLDRTKSVAEEITEYLKETDRNQKTIVFCATEEAALRMKDELVKLNSDMCKENPDYVVRITGSDDYGKKQLDYFISLSNDEGPVIVTTSKLLATGADCKLVKLIAIDQNINSTSEFKQIIGRGTRLFEKEGKTDFVIMDFRGVSRLFADPDWDGPIEQKEMYGHTSTMPLSNRESAQVKSIVIPKSKPVVNKDGCEVKIQGKMVSIYNSSGKLLKTINIIDYTKSVAWDEYSSLEEFCSKWSETDKKSVIRDLFNKQGIDLDLLKHEEGMDDVDDFDFICHIAYDQKPLTRRERAENVKKRDIFSAYGDDAREILNELLDKYANSSIYDIEDLNVLKLSPFKEYGSPSKIVNKFFGDKNAYMQAVHELEREIYRRPQL